MVEESGSDLCPMEKYFITNVYTYARGKAMATYP